MSTKAKILYTLLGTFFLILTALVLYISLDAAPYDDKHLALKKVAIPDEENGYLKILQASKLVVRLENISNVQSEYIAKILEYDRGKLLKNCILNKKFDVLFTKELLRLNKKSLVAATEALRFKKFYQNQPKSIVDVNDDLSNCYYVFQLVLLKSTLLLNQEEYVAYCESILDVWRLVGMFDESSNVVLESMVAKDLQSNSFMNIRMAIQFGGLDPELAKLKFGKYLKSSPDYEAYAELLRRDYHVMKRTIENEVKMNFPDIPEFALKFLFKKNVSIRKWGEYFTRIIGQVSKLYIKDEGARFDSLYDFVSSNCAGDMMFQLLVPLIEKYRRDFNRHSAKKSLLASYIGIKCFEKKYGKLPTKLKELVPEFFLKIPIDYQSNKPIQYSSVTKQTWALYGDTSDETTYDYIFDKEDAVISLDLNPNSSNED